MEDKLNEWKDRWENGDVKFVPELFEEVEHLQFENEIIRRNRTVQERKDFNRIKQLENEIKTLKSLMKIKGEETTFRIQGLETANDLLHKENQEYEKALIDIVELPTAQYIKDGQIISYKTIAKEVLGEWYSE
jgi:hypothetical protein